MADPASETIVYPFVAFNFAVEINLDGASDTLCSASFSECDGLDVTMEVKTIREGGNNGQQFRMAGPRTYGQVTMKRGMTANFDLWDWVEKTLRHPSLRARAEGVLPTNTGGATDTRGTSATQFVGKGTTKLSVQLWFDVTSVQPSGEAATDVRELTKKVAFFITPKPAPEDPTKNVPPGVRFVWG